jgi:hypothetical protein
MGRPNSVMAHEKRLEIDRALRNGESLTSISARFESVSVSALSRYAISQKAALVRLMEAEEGPADLTSRFREVADSARKLRQIADLGGSTSERARALSTELSVLVAISDRLGIDDLSITELHNATGRLVSVLEEFAVENPGAASALIALMAKHPELAEFSRELGGK